MNDGNSFFLGPQGDDGLTDPDEFTKITFNLDAVYDADGNFVDPAVPHGIVIEAGRKRPPTLIEAKDPVIQWKWSFPIYGLEGIKKFENMMFFKSAKDEGEFDVKLTFVLNIAQAFIDTDIERCSNVYPSGAPQDPISPQNPLKCGEMKHMFHYGDFVIILKDVRQPDKNLMLEPRLTQYFYQPGLRRYLCEKLRPKWREGEYCSIL